VDPDRPSSEFRDAARWPAVELHTEYTRMKSRQTYAYGVGYHLTGDEGLLALAKQGVDYLRNHALERDTGSAITYWRGGVAGPPAPQRTSQDLAYAQVGLAFYYYLTRDADVLDDILLLKNHIFEHYYQPDWRMLLWTTADDALSGSSAGRHRKELVAQLDQIHAYMLLLAPLLQDKVRDRWQADLLDLVRAMIESFFAPSHGLFFGSIHSAATDSLFDHHTDFGHTIKALWMIYLVGRLANRDDLIEFARTHANRVLERAYVERSGSWASRPAVGGELDER
jgi:mannose/cellobiose epimerase-like protein (N-acyl-D-glucosamine 2-epimerase family)